MTLSDSWDTPPSNPNNRRSSVFHFMSKSFDYTYMHIYITSKFLRCKIAMADLIYSKKFGLNVIQIASYSQWARVYSDFTHNQLATFREMSFLRMDRLGLLFTPRKLKERIIYTVGYYLHSPGLTDLVQLILCLCSRLNITHW